MIMIYIIMVKLEYINAILTADATHTNIRMNLQGVCGIIYEGPAWAHLQKGLATHAHISPNGPINQGPST